MATAGTQSADDVLERLGKFFQGLSLSQRLLLAAGVLLVAATVWIFVVLLGEPKCVTLYSGLRPEDAQRPLVGTGATGHPATGRERRGPAASGKCHRR